jgi:tryptophan-rich sensory protein
MKSKLQNLFFIFFPLLGGSVVGFIIKDAIDYKSLILPPFAPSSIVFPIAWTILYILIGISYYWYRLKNDDFLVKFLYYGQLFFNFIWSLLFFLLKWRLLSIFWIIILILIVGYLMYFYYFQEKRSFYLLIPYLLWLTFALYLNFGVYLLN